MAILPTGYNVAATGIAAPTSRTGATILGITSGTTISSTSQVISLFPLQDAAIEGLSYEKRSVPKETTGTGHAFHVQKAYTAGTFAYDQSEWMIRTVADTVNNVSNRALLGGNEQFLQKRSLRQKAWGAGIGTAYRAGYWKPVGVANQRSNWSTYPSALTATFKSTTNNGTDSDDQGIYVTYKSVPGELVYMYGALDPKLDDYKARG